METHFLSGDIFTGIHSALSTSSPINNAMIWFLLRSEFWLRQHRERDSLKYDKDTDSRMRTVEATSGRKS